MKDLCTALDLPWLVIKSNCNQRLSLHEYATTTISLFVLVALNVFIVEIFKVLKLRRVQGI